MVSVKCKPIGLSFLGCTVTLVLKNVNTELVAKHPVSHLCFPSMADSNLKYSISVYRF